MDLSCPARIDHRPSKRELLKLTSMVKLPDCTVSETVSLWRAIGCAAAGQALRLTDNPYRREVPAWPHWRFGWCHYRARYWWALAHGKKLPWLTTTTTSALR
jgi:hypothetical protein